MNLLTVIVLILFAIFILRGYRRGFIKSLASMISIVLSIVLVNIANPYVTDFLKTQTPLYDYVLEKCKDTFDVSKLLDHTEGQTVGAGNGSAQQEEAIDRLPLPGILKNILKENNTPEYYRRMAVQSFAEYVPRYMADLLLSIVSFVAAWILIVSFIWLAVMTLDMIAGLPIIRGVNQILGLVLGFLQGLIIVWIIFLIITVFSHTDAGRQLMDMIAQSPILETLYDTNILLDVLSGVLGG